MKLSITSRRPQTTRHRITGIVTEPGTQLILVDTPGFQTAHGGTLNKLMNRAVTDSMEGADVVMFVVEAGTFGADDRAVLARLPQRIPIVLVINKIDRSKDKRRLLPFIARVSTEFDFAQVVPVSAAAGTQVERLLDAVKPYLPERPALYREDEVTDRPERFLAAELLREKLFRLLGEELPYAATVVVEKFETQAGLRRIYAAIVVDKPNHKAMVIGKRGAKLKDIASQARVDMEKLFGGKVFLEVWVRVKSGWAESVKTLRNLGYD